MKWLLLQAISFTPHHVIFGDIPEGGSCAACTAGTTPLSAGLCSHLAVEKLTPEGIPDQKVLLKSCALGGIAEDLIGGSIHSSSLSSGAVDLAAPCGISSSGHLVVA